MPCGASDKLTCRECFSLVLMRDNNKLWAGPRRTTTGPLTLKGDFHVIEVKCELIPDATRGELHWSDLST